METKTSNEKVIAVKTIDGTGRVVLPYELRRKLDLCPKENVRFIEKGGEIVIEKYMPVCTFCGSESFLVKFGERYICEECNKLIPYLRKDVDTTNYNRVNFAQQKSENPDRGFSLTFYMLCILRI